MKVKVTQSCPTLCNPMDSPQDSPSQNTGVGSLSLLHGIFTTQGSNPGILHYRWILYQLSHKRSPQLIATSIMRLFLTVALTLNWRHYHSVKAVLWRAIFKSVNSIAYCRFDFIQVDFKDFSQRFLISSTQPLIDGFQELYELAYMHPPIKYFNLFLFYNGLC